MYVDRPAVQAQVIVVVIVDGDETQLQKGIRAVVVLVKYISARRVADG